jgi:hypothetical protein
MTHTQTWVQAHLITGALSALTVGIYDEKVIGSLTLLYPRLGPPL